MFRQLLPTIANMFQISYKTIVTRSWSYSQTVLRTLPDMKQYLHFQGVTGKQYYKVHIKQY